MLVAVGGSLGALSRYAVGLAAARIAGSGFPWGTLAVNVIGCFLMGIVMEWILDLESHKELTAEATRRLAFWRQGVAIGFLGGLTTFSSFGADTLRELHAGQVSVGLGNIAANVLLSLAAVWAGMSLMQALD
jgi:CrcB protein